MEKPPFWWYLPGKIGIFMGELLVYQRVLFVQQRSVSDHPILGNKKRKSPGELIAAEGKKQDRPKEGGFNGEFSGEFLLDTHPPQKEKAGLIRRKPFCPWQWETVPVRIQDCLSFRYLSVFFRVGTAWSGALNNFTLKSDDNLWLRY